MTFVSKEDIKTLSQTNVWKSLGQIIFDYVCIALFISIGIYFSNIFINLLMMLLIAARQHSLGGLVHDSLHYRFCKNKTINDLISQLFMVFPIWGSLYDYRFRHSIHHKETNTENDPDYINKKDHPEYQFTQRKIYFLKNIFKHLFGIHLICNFVDRNKTWEDKIKYFRKGMSAFRRVEGITYRTSYKEKFFMFVFNFILLGFLFFQGWLVYYLIYWVLPFVIYLPFLIRIRSIVEHFGVIKTDIEASRNMYPQWWDELFLGFSWNSSYHLDHHLYPSVPTYNVRKLHKILLQNKEYRAKANNTPQGTWGLFKECTL
jgi:fatty acid desaturase